MTAKKEYSEGLNKVLGTSIDWTKLTVEDLVQLCTLVEEEIIVRSKKEKEDSLKSLVKDSLGDWLDHSDGPIAKFLRGKKNKKEPP